MTLIANTDICPNFHYRFESALQNRLSGKVLVGHPRPQGRVDGSPGGFVWLYEFSCVVTLALSLWIFTGLYSLLGLVTFGVCVWFKFTDLLWQTEYYGAR